MAAPRGPFLMFEDRRFYLELSILEPREKLKLPGAAGSRWNPGRGSAVWDVIVYISYSIESDKVDSGSSRFEVGNDSLVRVDTEEWRAFGARAAGGK